MELPQETKQRYFEFFLNAFSPSKARPAYIAEMKAKLGDEELIKISAKRSTMMFGIFAEHGHQIVPNQSEFGLESVSWKSFFCFQTKLELVWKIQRIFWV